MKKNLFVLLVYGVPSMAAAASVALVPTPQAVGIGEQVALVVSIDSDQPVNAFAGTLVCPNSLSPQAIDDGNSIVSAWIERPAVQAAGIRFAGITPGGFAGRSGKLFTVIFKGAAEGTATCSLEQAQVLRSDGAGTREQLTISANSVRIGQKKTGGYMEARDVTPPEIFTIYPASSPGVSGGATYLTFAAVDKGSGIDHYEAAETRFPPSLVALQWRRTSTLYVPVDQYGTSDVYIRALDRAGNARTEVFPRAHLFSHFELTLGSMLLIFVIAWHIVRRRRA